MAAAPRTLFHGVAFEDRNRLARQDQRSRARVVFERHHPRGDRLARIGRAPYAQAWNRPQRREVLDRLVRGSVLADEDGVV